MAKTYADIAQELYWSLKECRDALACAKRAMSSDTHSGFLLASYIEECRSFAVGVEGVHHRVDLAISDYEDIEATEDPGAVKVQEE